MSSTTLAHSARFAAAWLVLAALTVTLGLQLVAQLREFGTASLLTAQLCIRTTPAEPRSQRESAGRLPRQPLREF